MGKNIHSKSSLGVQPGDKVVLYSRGFGARKRVSTVTRVTPSGRFVVEGFPRLHFYPDGFQVGAHSYGSSWRAEKWTEEAQAEIDLQALRDEVETLIHKTSLYQAQRHELELIKGVYLDLRERERVRQELLKHPRRA